MNEQDLVGKTVFVACFYRDAEDHYLGRKLLHGRIVSVSAETGIRLHDEEAGEYHLLPLRVDALFPAPPGAYGDLGTGGRIENPDFLSQWDLKAVPGKSDAWDWVPCRVRFPAAPPQRNSPHSVTS